MKTKFVASFLLLSFAAQTLAIAESTIKIEPVKITKDDCVNTSLEKAHASVTNYANYKDLKGARLSRSVPDPSHPTQLIEIPLLTMVKSEPGFTKQEKLNTEADILVTLQPALLGKGKGKYYPTFLLRCVSSPGTTKESFTHVCDLDQKADHYGLSDFHSILTASENSPKCKPGETRLKYELVLVGNSTDIKEIKKQVEADFKDRFKQTIAQILIPVILALFDERSFFEEYYRNFYAHWVKSLSPTVTQ